MFSLAVSTADTEVGTGAPLRANAKRTRARKRRTPTTEAGATPVPLPPSDNARVRDFFERLNDELGHGLPGREARQHWEESKYGKIPRLYSTILSHLATTGNLLIVGSYLEVNVYASPRVAQAKQVRGRQFDDIVLEALAEAVSRANGPVLTKRINEIIGAQRTWRPKSMVNHVLRYAARRDSVSVNGRPHRVICHENVLPSGIPRYTWDIVSVDAFDQWAAKPVPAAIVSRRHAAVLTIEAARASLGTPPTRLEWRLYVEHARDHDPAAKALGKNASSGRLQTSVLFAEDGTPLTDATCYGLQRYLTYFATLRLGHCRYGLVPPQRHATTKGRPIDLMLSAELPGLSDAARVLDAIEATRLHHEINALATLREWWADECRRLGGDSLAVRPAIESLLRTRTTLLLSTMALALPLPKWKAAVDAAEHHLDTLDRWLGSSARSSAAQFRFRKELIARPRGALAIVRNWLTTASSTINQHLENAIASEALQAPVHGAADAALMRAMYDARFADHPQPPVFANMFRPARVAFDPDPRPGVFEAEGEGSLARGLRDRADAWMVAFAGAEAYTAWSLLQNAERVLGSLLRDPHYLEQLQAEVPRRARELHQSLWVARGLLGSTPRPDEVLSASSLADGRALLLATFLADPQRVSANVRATGAVWRASGTSGAEMLSDLAMNAIVRVRSAEACLLIE